MALTFDGTSKVITLGVGTLTLSVRDLWSRWLDWQATGDNSKYLPAMISVGGDDIDLGAGTKIPVYAYLVNGWRVRPQEASHTLNVTDGVLLVSGGGDPFLNTLGSYVVRINYQQPVQAISFSTGGGGGASLTAAEVWQSHDLEAGVTPEGAIRLLLSAVQGLLTITGTGPIRVVETKDLAGIKSRLVVQADTDGQRLLITRDPS